MAFGRYWALDVVGWVNLAILAVTLVTEVVAFVNCVTRRGEAFPVVGRLSKTAWVLMTGGAVAFTVVTGGATYISGSFLTVILAFIALGIALVYLLDIRPALRDVTEGRGGW